MGYFHIPNSFHSLLVIKPQINISAEKMPSISAQDGNKSLGYAYSILCFYPHCLLPRVMPGLSYAIQTRRLND